jgi:hypothetical protein
MFARKTMEIIFQICRLFLVRNSQITGASNRESISIIVRVDKYTFAGIKKFTHLFTIPVLGIVIKKVNLATKADNNSVRMGISLNDSNRTMHKITKDKTAMDTIPPIGLNAKSSKQELRTRRNPTMTSIAMINIRA